MAEHINGSDQAVSEAARRLAQAHYQVEPGISAIYPIVSDEPADRTIRLLEVNPSTFPSGIMPVSFAPLPAERDTLSISHRQTDAERVRRHPRGTIAPAKRLVLREPADRQASGEYEGVRLLASSTAAWSRAFAVQAKKVVVTAVEKLAGGFYISK